MPEKFKIPLSLLRPLQPACKNNQLHINMLRQSSSPDDWDPVSIVWERDHRYFMVIDGNHRFVAGWLENFAYLWCRIENIDTYLGNVCGIKALIADIEKRIEEYEMVYSYFMLTEIIPRHLRSLTLLEIISYHNQEKKHK